ncbi:Predicted GTPase [Actinomyces bovis]|uniref:Predicted GTPase n=1 Tax=Actinomyces bovis TaxID=1658 RepID=A0ABY1VQ89_9ACTO|nr:ABC transporter [Actinomyces bovis]SPT53811.1 Predicted GTPase [Actinomyces bovis]VEG53174.1 Predicted GTPase [Actinomyces israelii]
MFPTGSERPTADAPIPSEGAASGTLSRGRLVAVLTDLLGDLERLDLGLNAPGVEDARRLRVRLQGEVHDHVLPRLKDADAPAIVVVGGSTGAGKSTLVSSVLHAEVSPMGVLRPTTRTPVLVANPEDASSISAHPVAQVCLTVLSKEIPAGLAVVDASDLDSVHEANRDLAARLLEAADLWLFVTTAARYGDQTPWATLEDAVSRGTAIAVVLNRVNAKVLGEVRRDLIERLSALGLEDAPFFVVDDAGPLKGMLSAQAVQEVHDWLWLLAGRHRAASLLRRTGKSLWTSLCSDLTQLADDVDAQARAADTLEEGRAALLGAPISDLTGEVQAGSCGQGAPTTRWLTLASSGGALAGLATLAPGRRLSAGLFGRRTRQRSEALELLAKDALDAVHSRLEATLVSLSADLRALWGAAGAKPPAVLADASRKATSVLETWRVGLLKDCGVREIPHGLTEQSLSDLLVAAAVGVTGAVNVFRCMGLKVAADTARDKLANALEHAVRGLVPAGTARNLAPDPGLAAALRLRAAELRPLTRAGEFGGLE